MSRRIYDLTAIARPLEPAYRTNLAVLVLVPVVALLAAALSFAGLHPEASPLQAAATSALAAFGAWAVTRELAPDDNPAAFVSMLLAVAACTFLPVATVLPLFVTLFLLRIVNRTTGLAATPVDALLVTMFAAWVAWRLGAPLIALAAAAAFALDAVLPGGSVGSRVAAVVLAVLAIAGFAVPDDVALAANLETSTWLIVAGIAGAYGLTLLSRQPVRSTGDATGAPLSTARVRAGMLVGLLATFYFVVRAPGPAGHPDALLLACLAGVAAGAALTALRR